MQAGETGRPRRKRAERATLIALAGALLVVPALAAALGALAAAATDCSDSLAGALIIGALGACAAAVAWALRVRDPVWLALTCGIAGGGLGVLTAAISAITIGLDRCFVF
jgi:hypothetical protein